MKTRSVPTISGRLANALTVWSLLWGLAVGLAVWQAARHEVDELLDDTLVASAGLLSALAHSADAAQAGQAPSAALDSLRVPAVAATAQPPATGGSGRFAWQVLARDGTVLSRSPLAPAESWHAGAELGRRPDNQGEWRVHGVPLADDGRMLYVAQSRAERREASADVASNAVLSALAIGLMGHLWLRLRVRRELQPLQGLSDRLATLSPDDGPRAPGDGPGDAWHPLGPASRAELQPVHRAIELLTSQLRARIAHERAFAGHAAHALRTPLAGIDAQLAVVLRDCPAALQPRLQRVRDAAGRLQSVVSALLGLFRSGAHVQPLVVDVAQLVARLPTAAVTVQVAPGTQVLADPDLLAAALGNLLDNAQRHGARVVWIESPVPGALRITDDGPGVPPGRLQQLQAALDGQAYEGTTGLGLMLADRVARAHGGRVNLQQASCGFTVELQLGQAGPLQPVSPEGRLSQEACSGAGPA